MLEEAISFEMIKVYINTLNSEHMIKEEQALWYSTRKKLKRLLTWQELKDWETKQINQFMMQKMFGNPINPIGLLESAFILQPHWQYSVKCSGVQRSDMCCNGSNNAAPQLQVVASTWSSCVKLPVQRLFLEITANLGLTAFRGDTTDAYARFSAPTETYLTIDDACAD